MIILRGENRPIIVRDILTNLVCNVEMLIILNYKDGEICAPFDEISETVNKKGTLMILLIIRVRLLKALVTRRRVELLFAA